MVYSVIHSERLYGGMYGIVYANTRERVRLNKDSRGAKRLLPGCLGLVLSLDVYAVMLRR